MRGKNMIPGGLRDLAIQWVLIGAFLGLCGRGNAQDTIVVHFDCQQVVLGEQICIPVVVDHFINVTTFSLLITWDPLVLSFVDVQNEAFSGGAWFTPGPSDFRYIWSDLNSEGQDLPDGTILFEMCFNAIGIPGNTSIIDAPPFVLNPYNTTEFADPDAELIPFTDIPCFVEVVDPPTVAAVIESCGSPDGVSDGSFTITGVGGTPPYSYSWSGPVSGSSILATSGSSETQSVPPGNYTITITDNSGGSQMYQITVVSMGITPAITITRPVSCYSFYNGQIEVGAFGGNLPISVLWQHTTNPLYKGSGFITTDPGAYTLNSLPVGAYAITLIDASGCQIQDTISLSASPIVIDAVTTNATCLGATDGSVEVTFSGGRPYPGGIYEFTPGWTGSTFMTTSPVTGAPVLGPGEYWVKVCDSINGCCERDTFTIDADLVISADLLPQPPSCAGMNDAEVRVTGLTNGLIQGPYSIQLFDANKIAVQPPINNVTLVQYTNLTPGNYFVVVKEGTCRSDTLPVTIPDIEPVTVHVISVIPSGCLVGEDSGEATVEASGGTPMYDYSWDGGALSGAMVTGLASGNHFLTVTDANGCTAQLTVHIAQSTPPVIVDIVASNIGCNGGDATLEVIYTEGTNPVTSIQWSNGDTTAVITNVAPGTITVTVRDSLFCFAMKSFDVPDMPVIVIDSIVYENPTCGGDADGQIAVFASQGTAPYTYIWSTGDTTGFNLLAGLTAGNYSVTILDADTCEVMVDTSVMLTDPPVPQFVFSAITQTSCSDACDGMVTLTPANGVPGFPYSFIWDTGFNDSGNQSTAQDLCPGMHSVVITQDDLCFYTDSVLIPAPPPVEIDTTMLTNISCFGGADGAIAVAGNGGSAPYTYQWSIPGTDSLQQNLFAGSYDLTVTDNNGCSTAGTVALTEPDSLIMVIDSSALRPISCNFANSGVIAVTVEGGNGGYQFTWDPNVSTDYIANSVSAGQYHITVTDLLGCTDTTSILMSGPSPVVGFLPMIDDPLCFGDLTPVTIDSASGGVGGYTWNVNGGEPHSLDSVVLLPAGIYNIITQDSSGCKDTVQIILNNPSPLELTVLPDNPIVSLGDSIMLQVLLQGSQVSIDSISWVSNGPLSCNDCEDPYVMNVVPTLYTVTVWDENGCSASADVLVDVDNRRQVYIPNVFSPNFDGRNDQLVIFTGEGITEIPSMRIFDRWGETIVEKTQLAPEPGGLVVWDGTYKNKMMAPGVYVYYIQVKFVNGEVLNYRGDVTLVR